MTFCLAYIFSVFGYEYIFFIMTLHVYDLTKNALNVSIFTALTIIPNFLSPIYGAIADRYQRQRVLAVAALITSGLIFILSFTREIGGIYLLWFFISIALTMITNVRGSLFAEVLPAHNYHAGNSTMLALSNGTRIVAPLIGGLAISIIHINGMIYTVCLIYLMAAIISCLIKPRAYARSSGRLDQKIKGLAGFQYIKRNASIKYLVLISFFWRLFLGLQVSLWIIYVKTYLNGSDAQYGYFITLLSLGSIFGSIVGPWIKNWVSERTLIICGLCVHYSTFAALGLTNQFYPACVVVLISFSTFYATLVCMHTIRDRETQSSIRGRVYGTVSALLGPPAIISMIVGGYLAERVGVNWILLYAGILAMISLAGINLMMQSQIKTFRANNTPAM